MSGQRLELARCARFRTVHDGEVFFRQGDAIIDTSARYMVVWGSLMVFRNPQYAKEANEGKDYEQWFKRVCLVGGSPGAVAIRYGDCIDTCRAGGTCGDVGDASYYRRVKCVAMLASKPLTSGC